MARPGVTYQDVAKAANAVKDQGKNVTIENVRAILGTGSIGTINTHLRKWKEAQNFNYRSTSHENLPDELVSMMKSLWDRLIKQSQEHEIEIENHYQAKMDALQQELQKYKTNNQRWQQLFQQWQQEKSKLEQALQETQQHAATQSAKQDALLHKLEAQLQHLENMIQSKNTVMA